MTFDNDGNLDLFLANGHPDDKVETRDREVQYSEPMLLFRNTGPGTRPGFVNVSAAAGAVFNQRFAARGMAIGDFDNDGAVDVLVAVNNDAPCVATEYGDCRHALAGNSAGGKQGQSRCDRRQRYLALRRI